MSSVNYHFLVNALPELADRATERLAEIRSLIEANLDDASVQAFHYLLYRNDNKNLLKLMRKRDGILPAPTAAHFYEPAVFSFEDLEDMLISAYEGEAAIPAYMQAFLDEEKHAGWTVRERENRLLHLYYEAGTEYPQEFIRSMFLFKRDLKNILLALNARAHNFKITRITLGDYDLSTQVATSTQPDFGLAGVHEYIPALMNLLNEGKLLELEKEIDRLLLAHCATLVGEDMFNLNYVLYYFLELSLAHRWSVLSPEKGARALDELVADVIRSAARPREGVYA